MDYNHLAAQTLWRQFQERYQDYMTPAIIKAGEFVLEAHYGQNRKLDGLPYVSHVYNVAEIMLDNHLSENTVIAGILHDVIEDTTKTAEDILSLFPPIQGKDILRIIMADNESNKDAAWDIRKQETIDFAQRSNETDGLLLICIDKISNMTSMVKGLEADGNLMWHYFHSPKDKQIWYYESLYNIFAEKLSDYDTLLKRYLNLLNLLR